MKLTNKEDIRNWLNEHHIKSAFIMPDLTVNVDGGVNLANHNLESIPVQFGIVLDTFDCHGNHLKTLAGSPKQCINFYCHSNQLTNLIGSPEIVRANFYCSNNKLITLESTTIECKNNFTCSNNINLKDISHLPQNTKTLIANNCPLDPQLFPLDIMFELENFYHSYKNVKNALPFCQTLYEYNDIGYQYEVSLNKNEFCSLYEKYYLEQNTSINKESIKTIKI